MASSGPRTTKAPSPARKVRGVAARPERIALAIHGGAGDLDPSEIDPSVEAARRAALERILTHGRDMLRAGRAALDVVETCVSMLEDFEGFNAGRGSALTSEGTVEMDASVADGASLRAGGVAAVETLRNPVRGARLVLDRCPHVLLVGRAADRFCRREGAQTAPADYFIVARKARGPARPTAATPGTVGAVARDLAGHLAAATSTGGISRKMRGRVGDSPIPGAGVFADDSTCAVSATGDGEAILCASVAHEIDARIRLAGSSLAAASSAAMRRLVRAGGRGGVIAVDAGGRVCSSFCTRFLYRAWFSGEGAMHVAVTNERGPAARPASRKST